jgi:hypothetical protein
MGKKSPKYGSNCGLAVTGLYNKGIINKDTYLELIDVHIKACRAKHNGWSSGYNYSYESIIALHKANIIDKATLDVLKLINAEGNNGKHWS